MDGINESYKNSLTSVTRYIGEQACALHH